MKSKRSGEGAGVTGISSGHPLELDRGPFFFETIPSSGQCRTPSTHFFLLPFISPSIPSSHSRICCISTESGSCRIITKTCHIDCDTIYISNDAARSLFGTTSSGSQPPAHTPDFPHSAAIRPQGAEVRRRRTSIAA